jgi:hypothetical protein
MCASFRQLRRHRMRPAICFALLLAVSCRTAQDRPQPIPSTPVETTGAIARQLLSAKGFTWTSFQTDHVRFHMANGMLVSRIDVIADSVENARRIVLALVHEPDIPDEEPLELFLVETRDDMRRLIGDAATGAGYPSELTAVVVAGDGFRAYYRHVMTHTYLAERWGRRRAGSWLDEGLATRATGACQGYAIDALAAGYVERGEAPSLDVMFSDAFDSMPELPANFTAASFVDFFQRREGAAAVRALWRGEAREATGEAPLGPDTDTLWADWQRKLKRVAPAKLSSAWVRQDGC